jgi:glycosyltransferase involved in cell wall biosynthesis
VIIPTTRPDLLPRALRSVAAQTMPPLEVLAVCDGGPPPDAGTWPFPLRAVGIAPRQGPSAVRNAAVALSRSDHVAFLDDDDEWLPEHLAALAPSAERHLAFSDAIVTHEGEGWSRRFAFRFTPALLRRTNPIILSGVAMPKRAFWEVGGFDPTLRRYEAWDLFLRVQAAGTQIVRVPRATLHYRFSDRSVTADDQAMEDAFAVFRSRHGLIDLPRASFASMLTDRRFAKDRED